MYVESQNSMAFFDGTSQMIEENPTFSQKIELPEINLDEVSRNVEYKPNLLEEKPVSLLTGTFYSLSSVFECMNSVKGDKDPTD